MKNSASGDKTALKTDKNGKAIFSLKFSENDIGKTYKYKLYEINDEVQGITYDTDVYDIEIGITLGEDNKLVAKTAVNGKAVDAISADFENIYRAEDPQFSLTGDDRNISLWIAVLTISCAVCLAVVYIKKGTQTNHKF